MVQGFSQPDWNSNDEFFKFTRGRFIVDGEENLHKREVRFDMNRLARVAADSVGAVQCIDIKKYADGMFNKAFLMSMDDGREVVAKVPNPNAGIPHFTTASEVATMDFAREVLNTPVPHVHAWNSQAQSHPVGAEFIIMDKAEGVPLSEVWSTMKLPEKLQVLLAMIRLQKQWLSVSFSHYGSLYYSRDVRPPTGSYYVKDDQVIRDSKFTIGPATGRDWCDAGRSLLDVDRGPWASLTQYLQAVGTREKQAVESLKLPKQIALMCGPRLYQPDRKQKLAALACYQQVIEALIPKDPAITRPCLWHNDLHDDNIFVDPNNFAKVTGVIDWQSCHISPLFNHHPDPAFIDLDGSKPETLDLVPQPKLSGLSPEDRATAINEYAVQNLFIGWRKLMHSKTPDLFRVVEFRKTTAYGLLFLAHRMFEYGEAHFQSFLLDLKDTWTDLPAVNPGDSFPFNFSDAERERIKVECDGAVAGTDVMAEIKNGMGDLWPDKGLIEHERYDDCKAELDEIKRQMLDQLAETDDERADPHLLALAVGLCAVATTVEASEDSSAAAAGLVPPLLSSLSNEQIQEGLEQCDFVKQLNEQQAAAAASSSTSLAARLFTLLFPSSSPAVNALLATAYISGPPNFLLALCPPNIDPSSLSIMVAFAVGGLLGDTLFHLLPEIFLGEHEPDRVRFVLLEPNRNLLLGVGILSGIVTFMAMDKILRIATGANPSVKLAGLLNLIADFTHNITDGLALSSSFYASPALGATTTMAVFFHEIPHEVGDFALLIQSGFSKRKAMGAHLQWGDMLLPFTAGTFLYVGTVAVIPELLETSSLDQNTHNNGGGGKGAEIRKSLLQFVALFVGAAIMLGISWS
ncbi:hypothetical protein DV738_g409, partial [Chaetothyriales sp. CBS 135597]